MFHPEALKARATPTEVGGEDQRVVSDDGYGMLRPYFRAIGPLETLTSEQEVALAKAIEDYTRAMRREILSIPLSARLLVARWSELRSANRVTATLSAVPPDRRPPDASERMDEALRSVAAERQIVVIDIAPIYELVLEDETMVVGGGPDPSARQYAGWVEIIGQGMRRSLSASEP